ncbi:MAG: hypothetical protein JXX29_04485 [Deltaproteobacteria bacterium]|nr:hypothetical protein [Deltaproteobacteria bacterium]MBN2670902.1 hypothetical protein [Deltaproteobacteria bacterium]
MKRFSITWMMMLFMACCLFGLSMCGGDGPAEKTVDEELTAAEEEVLSDEFALDALETIDETNANAEAEKLAAEIEADE